MERGEERETEEWRGVRRGRQRNGERCVKENIGLGRGEERETQQTIPCSCPPVAGLQDCATSPGQLSGNVGDWNSGLLQLQSVHCQ